MILKTDRTSFKKTAKEVKKPMDNTNLYCHYGIIYWENHITDEIQWFYFKDVLLHAKNIIRTDYETKPLKYMFKVFCFFHVVFGSFHT